MRRGPAVRPPYWERAIQLWTLWRHTKSQSKGNDDMGTEAPEQPRQAHKASVTTFHTPRAGPLHTTAPAPQAQLFSASQQCLP